MDLYQAFEIISDLDDTNNTESDKAAAIYTACKFADEYHIEIPNMKDVCMYLWHLLYSVETGDEL